MTGKGEGSFHCEVVRFCISKDHIRWQAFSLRHIITSLCGRELYRSLYKAGRARRWRHQRAWPCEGDGFIATVAQIMAHNQWLVLVPRVSLVSSTCSVGFTQHTNSNCLKICQLVLRGRTNETNWSVSQWVLALKPYCGCMHSCSFKGVYAWVIIICVCVLFLHRFDNLPSYRFGVTDSWSGQYVDSNVIVRLPNRNSCIGDKY